jgi:hypothetical protein
LIDFLCMGIVLTLGGDENVVFCHGL